MSEQQFRPMKWQILPPVVKNLLIINGIMFLATVVFEDKLGLELTQYLGLHFVTSQYFAPHQFITHLFMHGNMMHVFSNMFALWMFGNVLENVWGAKRFLMYYMITGLGAALIHTGFTWYDIHNMQESVNLFLNNVTPMDFKMLVTKYQGSLRNDDISVLNEFLGSWSNSPNDPQLIQEAKSFAQELVSRKADIPTVGASGAVFGVLLAFGMLFPNTVLYIYFAFPIKAKWFVLLYGLFELYGGIQNNPGDNVAHFAHLGGMLFGYFLIRHWGKNRFNDYGDY